MFALHSQNFVQKCLLSRHVGAVASRMSLRRTFPHQCLGVTDFHMSACQCRDQLKKMFSNKKKKKWYETPQSVLTGQSSGFMKPAKKRSPEDSLRVRILNTILYKSISELLSSHEVNGQIPGYNVEITKVSLVADFSVCRIYWKTSFSSDRDGQIQQILDKCAPRIRYLLISQQILGSVPPLVFVLDKQYAALKEVENLLKMADYGPGDDAEKLEERSRKDAETSVRTEEKKRVVLGIDHDALYKQLEDYKRRSGDSGSEIGGSAALTREQLDMLAEIRKQKLVEKKKRKAKKTKDDDITPKEFLLMRQLQEEQDEQDDAECGAEGSERTS